MRYVTAPWRTLQRPKPWKQKVARWLRRLLYNLGV
jgi:hypothetical protein